MNDFEERGKEFKPTRTLKGLMVEFKGPYMSDEDWDKPETYKGNSGCLEQTQRQGNRPCRG